MSLASLYSSTAHRDALKKYLSQTNCPYCAQDLPDDFFTKREMARREKIKETYRKKREEKWKQKQKAN